MGEFLAVLCVAGAAALAARSLWRVRQAGGCCGDCTKCGRRCGK